MYLKKYENRSDKFWDEVFAVLPMVRTEFDRDTVKGILCSEYKSDIEEEKETLYDYGVINGTGPGFQNLLVTNYKGPFKYLKQFLAYSKVILSGMVRDLITWLFPYVDSFWHDIGYLLGGTEEDRKECDRNLYVHSVRNIEQAYAEIKSPVKKFLFGKIRKPFMILVAFLMYKTVSFLGNKGSFRYTDTV